MSEYSLDENTNQLRYINQDLEEIKEMLKSLIHLQILQIRKHTEVNTMQTNYINHEHYSRIVDKYESLPKSSDSK